MYTGTGYPGPVLTLLHTRYLTWTQYTRCFVLCLCSTGVLTSLKCLRSRIPSIILPSLSKNLLDCRELEKCFLDAVRPAHTYPAAVVILPPPMGWFRQYNLLGCTQFS